MRKNPFEILLKFYGLKLFFQKCFKFSILDIYKCPFLKYPESLCQKINFVTIIDFYGKDANYIFKMLLP